MLAVILFQCAKLLFFSQTAKRLGTFFNEITTTDVWWFEKKYLPLHAILEKTTKENINIYEQEICRTQRLEPDADEQ